MDINDIQLWQHIERLAFAPRNAHKRSAWLRNFHRFLPLLWGAGEQDLSKPVRVGGRLRSQRDLPGSLPDIETCRPRFDAPIGFFYDIAEDLRAFSIQVYWIESALRIEYDQRFLYEHVGSHPTRAELTAARIGQERIERLLWNRIAHPALHLHVGQAAPLHEIRIGAATRNPFLLLYQLAVQLVDFKRGNDALRSRETARLAAVVHEHLGEEWVASDRVLGVK